MRSPVHHYQKWKRILVPGGIVLLGLLLGWMIIHARPHQELVFKKDYSGVYDYTATFPLSGMTTSIKAEAEGAKIEFKRGDASLQILQPLAQAKLNTQKGQAIYTDASKNVELQYTLKYNGLKEDIVLHKRPNENLFASAIKLNNVTAQINSDGVPVFSDKQGNYQFHFEKPYAVDAKGERTNSVRYYLIPTKDAAKAAEIIAAKKKTGNKKLFGLEKETFADQQYVLMTEVDEKWLKDEKRTFPVTIDPTVVHDTTTEFATGMFDHVKDVGTGSTPNVQSYYGELPVDQYTAGLWHFNETVDDQCASGKDVCDISGNANDGAQSGGVAINTTTQQLGAAARTFDGTNDFFTVADANTLSFGNNTMSAEAWIKRSGNPAVQEYVILKGVTTWEYGVTVNTTGTVTGIIWTTAGSGVAFATSTTTVTDGNWHHVAFTSNGSVFLVYIDGKLDATSSSFTGTMTNTAASLFFGDRSDIANSQFQGDIDEIRISSIARTPEEIRADAQRKPYSVLTSDYVDFGSPVATWNNLTWSELNVGTGDGETATSSTGLVAAWNMNGTSGSTVTNDAGAGTCGGTASNCNGTLTNVSNVTGQDAIALSGWTANDRKWGAGAINFDGTDDVININPSGGAFDIASSGNVSVDGWIKGTANGRTIFIAQTDASHGLIYLTIGPTTLTGTNDKLVLYFRGDGVGATTFVFSGTTTIDDNQWHHVAFTAKTNGANRDIVLYVDGKVDATGTATGNAALTFSSGGSGSVIISAGSGGFTFRGTMDAIRYWNKALPPNEILSNYQAGALEVQTRVGADTTPNDGDWEDWKPTTSETQMDNIDNVVGWATPSASIWQTAQIATESSNVVKAEGASSLKVQTGKVVNAPNEVALWHFDETSGTGAYLKDQVKTSVASVSTGDGADGSVTISTSTNINTTAIASGRPTCLSSTSCADGIAYRVVAPVDSATSVTRNSGSDTLSNGIAVGDEVLLINLQGTSADNTDVGNYEFKEVQSISASTITFTSAITKSYDGTTASNQKVVVQRVPNYVDVTVSSGGTLTASAYDVLVTTPTAGAGYRTGIVAFRATGTVTVSSGGSISTSSLGYAGAAANAGATANQGASYSGAGTASTAANGGGGGGGLRETAVSQWNATGGAGGGYGAAGTAGGSGTLSGGPQAGGTAGAAYGTAALTKIYYGSGGGGGGGANTDGAGATAGGRGGGILFISSNTITVSGTMPSNGANGGAGGWGGGGGGAGGSIYLAADTVTIGSSLVTATAGSGGAQGQFGLGGGAGAVGRINIISPNFTGTTSPTANTDTLLNATPNGTTSVDGITGKARSFNGTSDYASVPDNTDIDLTGGTLTTSLWVKPGSTQVANARIFSHHGTTANSGYTFEMNATPNSNVYYFSWGTGAGFQCTATTIALTPNTWQHVAFTKSGTLLSLYVNGVLSTTCTGASATVANTVDLLYFGRLASSATGFWNGSIDEVMFSTAALGPNEIAELYRAGGGHRFAETISSTDLSSKKNLPFYIASDRPGTYLQATVGESLLTNYETEDTNLRGFWHLEEPNSTIKDSASLGNHLTVTNGAAFFPGGYLAGARSFDGTNDYLTCTDAACGGTTKLDPSTGSWSMGAWVNTTKVPTQMVIAKGTASGQYAYQVQIVNGGSPVFDLLNTANTAYIEASASARVNDGFWHHVMGTYDGTTAKIYIDGVLQASSTTKVTPQVTDSTSDFQIGARTDCATCYFKGLIDEPFVIASAPSADQVRQMAEVKNRSFPITIDFGANLVSSNLITGSSDLTFDIDATAYGAANKGDNLYFGDKIIIKENVDGTEYLAQGTVTNNNITTGAIRVVSWDSGSTFPSSGFTNKATVFKWERQYWNITKPFDAHVDAVTRLTFLVTAGGEGRSIYLDDLRSATDYLTTPGGSTITSSTGYRFLQYRVVNSLVDYTVSPALTSLTLDYTLGVAPNTPTLDSPADAATNQTLTPTLLTTATDTNSDYLRYKLQICTDSGMTTGCTTFDQTSSQTGWSGQNAQTSTAYTSGTQATFTVPSGLLSLNTTYYWRTYAIDPGGSNTFSGTQTPRSFTTSQTTAPPSCTVTKNGTNTSLTVNWTDIFSGETNFTVEKNTDAGGFSSFSTPAANVTTATDATISSGHTYQYRIKANLGTNSTEWCTTSMITTGLGFFNIN
jgi:hypothetical protein